MSGTDKTRPWGVKCLDDPSWLAETHDHRDGTCDLPARPTKVADPFGGISTRCTWSGTREFWASRANGCGCTSCSAQYERRAERRRSRHQAQEETAAEQRHLDVLGANGTRVVDDLSDVADPWADPHLGYGGFHDDVAWYAAIRDRLGLPATSHVVDVSEDIEADGDSIRIAATRYEVLHNDGRRETLTRPGGGADLFREQAPA